MHAQQEESGPFSVFPAVEWTLTELYLWLCGMSTAPVLSSLLSDTLSAWLLSFFAADSVLTAR